MDVFVANADMAISKAVAEQTIEEYRKQMSSVVSLRRLRLHVMRSLLSAWL